MICSISSLMESPSFNCRPDTMDIIVIFEGLEKFAGLCALLVGQLRKTFRDVTELAGHDGPAVRRQPLGDGMQIAALGNEARAGCSFRDIVILRWRERLNVLSICFDRGRFNIRIRIRMVRIDESDMIEEERDAARRADLTSFLGE